MSHEFVVAVGLLGILSMNTTWVGAAQPRKAGAADIISLPAPVKTGRISLEEALARRRSVREFSGKELTIQQIGQLLWAAQGITHGDGLRTSPSAGALYPLELYVATSAGLFHYDPRRHQLQRRSDRDLRRGVQRTALGQDAVGGAPALFILTAVYERTARKYGPERSRRYVFMEAGHAAQNLLLEAAGLGLGGVPVGAFEDRELHKVLSLPAEQEPIYLMPVGYPRE